MRLLGTSLVLTLIFLQITILTVTARPSVPDSSPLEIDLSADRKTTNQGDTTQAILTLQNTSSYTITNLIVEFESAGFSTDLNSTPATLAPFTSIKHQYTLQSRTAGVHNVLFTIAYEWFDPETTIKQHRISQVSIDELIVESPPSFDWPDFLIPLIVGFVIGQFGATLSEWRKERKERKSIKSVILTFLVASRKSVQENEQIPLDLWKEIVAKSDLYSVLSRSGNKDLPARLTELTITFNDYNERQLKSNLTDSIVNKLDKDILDLKLLIENERRGLAKWLRKQVAHS